MRKIYIIPALILGILIFSYFNTFTSTSNPPLAHTGAPGESNCTSCHSGGGLVTSGSIWNNATLTTSTSLSALQPSTTYTMSLTFTDPSRVKYGFQLVALPAGAVASTASIGTLASINTATGVQTSGSRQYIFHTASGTTATGNTRTWTFNYTTPANLNQNIVFHVIFNSTNNNNSSSGDVIYYKTFSGITLPVKWGKLIAMRDEYNKPIIKWQTVQEINNSHFIIQRSEDNNLWIDAGTVLGANNSNISRTYSFTDSEASPNSLYYRIKQVDYDGIYDYSPMISISNTSKFEKLPIIEQRGRIILGFSASHIYVYTNSGQLIHESKLDKGESIYLKHLPQGVYIIKAIAKNEHNISRILLQ